MLEALVDFEPSVPVRATVHAIGRTNLHRHTSALEIVYVLRGELRVTVSCEHFDLREGDFAVLNRGDPHQLWGSADNMTALLHVDLSAFVDVDPNVEHLIFACESFDLARHRGQEAMLRGLLLDVLGPLVSTPEAAPADPVVLRSRELVRLLCAGYSLENYYNRATTLTSAQRARFHAMLRLLREYADQRDVLGLLSREHHYSKSYVSHFFKEASGVGLSDLLGYLRVAMAEHLLLSSDATMLEVSARCGFSDVKYFTRTFVDWFHQSPADYRKRYQPETLRDNEFNAITVAEVDELVRLHRRQVASPAADGPRLSVTPLLLKNLGSRLDLFSADREPERTTDSPARVNGPAHLVPVRVTKADLDGGFLVEGIASFDQLQTTPCVVVEFASARATLELVMAVIERLGSDRASRIPIWLSYGMFHDRSGVDEVVAAARYAHGIDVQPIMMP